MTKNLRKKPVQARSSATLDALHAAMIQVLTKEGLKRCTTTRIAERAGVSVGSLYQYYPNRDALLATVVDRELDRIVGTVHQTYREWHGQPLAQMTGAFVANYLGAKLCFPAESRAIYAVAQQSGGAELIAHARSRIVATLAAMLASAPDARFDNPAIVATVALGALFGPIQSLLDGHAPVGYDQQIEQELSTLLRAYFAISGQAAPHMPSGETSGVREL